MTKIEKARTVQIELGDSTLNCLVLPDGSYKVATSQIAQLFAMPQKNASRDFKALLPAGFQYLKIKTDLLPRAIPVLDLESVGVVALALAFKGNTYAQAYLVACNSETLERRIDAQLKVIRSEEDRNRRFQARVDGILSRHFWTDTIAWYMNEYPVSDNYKRFTYSNVSDCVNKAYFGLSAKKIREYYDIKNSEAVRDFIPERCLRSIDHVECYAAQLVKFKGYEPLAAIKESLEFWNIQITSLDA